mmetsp:Transcript_31450/g.71974  ORF Transcript_31450/g.71974 Transcript_31450/m.71974 type:complete len:879 (-) Transcript_31450:62-2698(-)
MTARRDRREPKKMPPLLVFFFGSVLLLLGTIKFMSLNVFYDWLYVYDGAVDVSKSAGSCITRNEWIWTILTNALVLLALFVLPFLLHCRNNRYASTKSVTTTKKQALVLFLIMNMVWFVLPVAFKHRANKSSASPSSHYGRSWWIYWLGLLGGKAAWPAMFDILMMLFPVNRILGTLALSSSPAFSHTFSHRDLLPWHEWCGDAIVFWIIVHTIFLSLHYFYGMADSSLQKWIDLMAPAYFPVYTEGDVNFAGWLGFLPLLGIWITSRQMAGRKVPLENTGFSYGTSYAAHVLLTFAFIYFSNLHDYNTIFFFQAGYAALVADWFLRKFSHEKCVQMTLVTKDDCDDDAGEYCNDDEDYGGTGSVGHNLGVAVITGNEESSVVSVNLPIPPSWLASNCDILNPHRYSNMFVYLSDASSTTNRRGSWRRHQHPFSISSVDNVGKTFTLHIKALGDWTSSLVLQSLLPELRSPEGRKEHRRMVLAWDIEGPYRSNPKEVGEDDRGNVLFLAAGVGLTGITTIICSKLHVLGERRLRDRAETIDLVWWVRTLHEAQVLRPLVDEIVRKAAGAKACHVRVRVYVTREDNGEELPEAPPSSLTTSKRFGVYYHHRGRDKAYTPEDKVPSLHLQQFMSVAGAILGSLVGLVLGRLICCNWPVLDEETGQKLHRCAFLSTSTTCASWYNDHDPNRSPPRCTSTVCYYCFRGAPQLLAFVLTPILAHLLPKLAEIVVARLSSLPLFNLWRRNDREHVYNLAEEIRHTVEDGKVPYADHSLALRQHKIPLDDIDANVDVGPPSDLSDSHDATDSTTNSMTSDASSTDVAKNVLVRWERRRAGVGEVLEDDRLLSPNTTTVVCGPDVFVHAVRQEVHRLQPAACLYEI